MHSCYNNVNCNEGEAMVQRKVRWTTKSEGWFRCLIPVYMVLFGFSNNKNNINNIVCVSLYRCQGFISQYISHILMRMYTHAKLGSSTYIRYQNECHSNTNDNNHDMKRKKNEHYEGRDKYLNVKQVQKKWRRILTMYS